MALSAAPKTDVLVAGAGPAGIVAAIAAARAGARTMLIERFGFLGGELVTGLNLHGFWNPRDEQVVRGIGWEIIERLLAMHEAAVLWKVGLATDPGLADPNSPDQTTRLRDVCVDTEAFKYVALQMLEEAGVRVLFHASVSDVLLEGAEIRGLVVETKSGRTLVPAERVVDCTGDGDVAARAGVPFEKGRLSDGVMQPLSLMFTMGGVDLDRALQLPNCRLGEAISRQPWQPRYMHFTIPLLQWRDELRAAFPEIPAGQMFSRFTGNSFRLGVINANTTAHIVRRDATDALDLSQAEIQGRKMAFRMAEFMRRQVPGFENSYLIHTAAHIGVRETRRIHGEYRLTYEDVVEARQQHDVVALGCYHVDIHHYDGVSSAYTPQRGTRIKEGRGYDIPYGCLVPRRVEHLLVAGRCLSASQEAQGSARVIATCMAMGHAAGTAAALSLQQGVSPRRLEVGVLQQALERQGAYLGERSVEAEAPRPG